MWWSALCITIGYCTFKWLLWHMLAFLCPSIITHCLCASCICLIDNLSGLSFPLLPYSCLAVVKVLTSFSIGGFAIHINPFLWKGVVPALSLVSWYSILVPLFGMLQFLFFGVTLFKSLLGYSDSVSILSGLGRLGFLKLLKCIFVYVVLLYFVFF